MAPKKGFIPWIQSEMMHRKCFFSLASDKVGGEPGIRPVTNKIQRFNVVVPWFKAHLFFFPEELRYTKPMVELYDELSLASPKGFKSKKDDFADTISMLGAITAYRPSEVTPEPDACQDIWGDWEKPDTSTGL